MNNNNRGNNNRRRGRGNSSGGGNTGHRQNGGQQLNRIDSRARGNAPQLLEKYRKLAHDAHLNGDRVTEEYNLQFADHYFRVLADTRQRQDEQRPRRDERWQDNDPYREEADEAAELAEGEASTYGEVPASPPRRERNERPREERARDDRPREAREDRPRDDRPRDDRPREERPRREDRAPRAEAAPAQNTDAAEAAPAADGEGPQFEPAENPFTRESRSRGLKPRRDDRRPRRGAEEQEQAEPAGIDAASLPPSISTGRGDAAEAVAEAETQSEAPAEEAKPRRRTRRPKASPDDSGESLEAVG